MILLGKLLFSQSFIPAYQVRANQVTQTNITTYLQEFENLGVKRTGSIENENALIWLKNKYLSFGYTESQIEEDPFSFGDRDTKNLIVTKTGTLYPDQFVIVCGHFDSIVGPGTNDNGSGVSVILEIARILQNVPTDYSIRFINFSGEEQGLYGSTHYVQNVVNATQPKMKIKLVFNIDEVGGVAGSLNDKIVCERDETSPNANNAASNLITQELAVCTQLYSPLQTVIKNAYSSDYMPFEANGEIITGFYENNISTHPHSETDILANMDPVYVYQVAKAAIGAVQHFAVASTTDLSVNSNTDQLLQSIQIYPNPVHHKLNVKILNSGIKKFKLVLKDASGKQLCSLENETTIDISNLPNGIYFATIIIENQEVTKKILVQNN